MFFKPRNVLMMLFVLLFTVSVGCGDDDNKRDNNKDETDVRVETDAGPTDDQDANVNDDADDQADTDPPAQTCVPLSPAVGSCDSLCNTGCGAGEACITATTQAGAVETTCQPTGPGAQGDSCGQEGCQEGHGCLSTDGTNASCLAYCRPNVNDPSQCAEGTVCQGFSQSTPGIGVCVVAPNDGCTVYPNEGCADDEQCYPAQGGGTICRAFNAEAEAGQACTTPDSCNEDQACIGADAASLSCMDMCSTAAPDCEDGKTCQAVQGAPFGVCAGA